MDGKGAWRDNVFVERLWRTVKYEEVYLLAYDSVSDARASLGRYLDLYNRRRPHSSLEPHDARSSLLWLIEMLPVRLCSLIPGRGSTHRSGKTVRTSGATSLCGHCIARPMKFHSVHLRILLTRFAIKDACEGYQLVGMG